MTHIGVYAAAIDEGGHYVFRRHIDTLRYAEMFSYY